MEFIPAKSMIFKNKDTSWFGIDYTMNIYKGCCHGCIYCDSRSDCYGIDQFDIVRAKENAPQLVQHELKHKRQTGVIGTGSMSDPYNPFERKYGLTRSTLEFIHANKFGVAIATKSDLITRDIDLLSRIKKHSPVIAKLSITSCDDELCQLIEPHVAPSSKRFAAIEQLASQDIFTGVLMMPILPFIEDNEDNIRGIIKLAKQCGAKFIYPAFGMTLRANQRDWYFDKLDRHFPHLKDKYIKQYGHAYECPSPHAHKLWSMFTKECNKLGILYQMKDIIHAYKNSYQDQQLSFF
ncbi:radical SAM protein [Paenibacillus albiflavus]|uniref:Radical SAM protein n=1 Tax=Paenibacillus albiflavus TaxID=2545760 RepID=A0A4V2WMV6_9BACL|nr:radical SAM protein [Paenibacillus albiflavus]TCZ72862.1 radical SAM protein [Paenibacillus albiflavus]